MNTKELITLAVENKEREYNSEETKIKGLLKFMGLVSFNITDQQLPKKEIFKHWRSFLIHNPLVLFKVICYPVINFVLICLNILYSICNLVDKTIVGTACVMPIIYWLSQKSDNKMSVSELFNSYGWLFVWFMLIIIIAKMMYLMTVDVVTNRINEIYKKIFLTPFKLIDLVHITIWYQSTTGKVTTVDYNIDKDYYKLKFSKEEILQILIQDKLTLDELSMYYDTLSSVDKFFLMNEFARKSESDYAEKSKIKRLAKGVYMERKGIAKR